MVLFFSPLPVVGGVGEVHWKNLDEESFKSLQCKTKAVQEALSMPEVEPLPGAFGALLRA